MTDADGVLTVYSDYVCPFCYLGRESLRRYRETREAPLDVEWHPFDLRGGQRGPDGELDPAADDGKDEAYYEQVRENVRRLQDRYGVEMELEVAGDVDSLPAQVAADHVQPEYPERWPAFDDAVFEALWVDGRDIGDPDVLADVAGGVGLDPEEIVTVAGDAEHRDRVFERFHEARRRGVTGVPTFVYDEHAARGAVPPAQLRRLIEGE